MRRFVFLLSTLSILVSLTGSACSTAQIPPPPPAPNQDEPILTPSPPSHDVLSQVRGVFALRLPNLRGIFVVNGDGSFIKKVTVDGEDVEVSPDRERIAFTSNTYGNYDIFAMNMDGANVVRLTRSESPEMDPQWSPDGKYILYNEQNSIRKGPGYLPPHPGNIYVMNSDGTDKRRVSSGDVARWVPNRAGAISLIERTDENSNGFYEHRLVIVEPDGYKERISFKMPYEHSGGVTWKSLPSQLEKYEWSPDGERILLELSGWGDVLVADSTGTVFDWLVDLSVGRDKYPGDISWFLDGSGRIAAKGDVYTPRIDPWASGSRTIKYLSGKATHPYQRYFIGFELKGNKHVTIIPEGIVITANDLGFLVFNWLQSGPENIQINKINGKIHLQTIEPRWKFTELGSVSFDDADISILPKALIANDDAINTYRAARRIMDDNSVTRREKKESLRVLQNTAGEELFTSVIRFVPVYDDDKGRFLTFESYAHSFATSEGSQGDTPIEQDPVGAGMRIFFDPSPETIRKMLGLD